MEFNKKVLQSNFIPETIFHRDDQIKTIAGVLAPSLKLDRPSNLFIYGKNAEMLLGFYLSKIRILTQVNSTNQCMLYVRDVSFPGTLLLCWSFTCDLLLPRE